MRVCVFYVNWRVQLKDGGRGREGSDSVPSYERKDVTVKVGIVDLDIDLGKFQIQC